MRRSGDVSGPAASCWWTRLGRWLPRSIRSRPSPLDEPDPRTLGRHGEEIAARTLAGDGLRIIARNRRVAGVEIDVIAESPTEDLLLVVEVKTVRGVAPPEHRVDRSRRVRLARAATSLARKRAVAIEVVTVNVDAGRTDVRRFRLEGSDIPTSILRRGRSKLNGR